MGSHSSHWSIPLWRLSVVQIFSRLATRLPIQIAARIFSVTTVSDGAFCASLGLIVTEQSGGGHVPKLPPGERGGRRSVPVYPIYGRCLREEVQRLQIDQRHVLIDRPSGLFQCGAAEARHPDGPLGSIFPAANTQ